MKDFACQVVSFNEGEKLIGNFAGIVLNIAVEVMVTLHGCNLWDNQ